MGLFHNFLSHLLYLVFNKSQLYKIKQHWKRNNYCRDNLYKYKDNRIDYELKIIPLFYKL